MHQTTLFFTFQGFIPKVENRFIEEKTIDYE
jgi:hypothetical protein